MAEQLTFTTVNPLGAGDLIDRAVRLYRKNFWTLIKIAAPPILISALGSMLLAIGWRQAVVTTKDLDAIGYISMIISGVALWVLGMLMTLMVMGGASRNLVRHLLWGEALTFRETYKNTLSRFFGLLGASLIISAILYFTMTALAYILAILLIVVFAISALLTTITPVLGAIFGIIMGTASIIFIVWLFFLIASRFAYMPQIMLVEGQGVFAALGRSTTLASGNVKRLAALVTFTLFAVLSALTILLLPLIWYAAVNGIELFAFGSDLTPVWYLVGWQVVWQLSWILLTPVWMTGLSLLYVDERVRHEGYDIELMAARQLGEIPSLPRQFQNPLHPALAQNATPPPPPPSSGERSSSFTTLGLN
jgi:hypothetical protein